MRKTGYILLLIALLGSFNTYATPMLPDVHQTVKLKDDIKTMFENEQYQDIITQYAGTPRTLTTEELTYVAQSYLYLDDTTNAMKYIELAIQKSSKYAKAYCVKGTIAYTAGDYTKALTNIQQAILIDPKQAEYYTELGNIYLAQDNYGEALINYRKAIKPPHASEKAYYMIGAVYAGRGDTDRALDTFYVAKTKITKDKELYVTLLYNIGKMEYDKKDYRKAVDTYRELVEYFPDDYYSLEKIVECYNALGNFNEADNTKSKLYAAHESDLLSSSSMSDMFSLEVFTVGEKTIAAYERFEEPSCRDFNKNIFYVADKNGNIESCILLEYKLPKDETSAGLYQLVMEKDSKRHIYNIAFDKGIRYETLKPYIVKALNGELEIPQ